MMLTMVMLRFVTTVGLLLQSSLAVSRFRENLARNHARRTYMHGAEEWERGMIEENWRLFDSIIDAEERAVDSIEAFLKGHGTMAGAASKTPSFKSRIGMHYMHIFYV